MDAPVPSFMDKISRPVHPGILFVLGWLLLFGLYWFREELRLEALGRQASLASIFRSQEQMSLAFANAASLRDLRLRDVTRFKEGLSGLVQSKRTMYEAGIDLQEEKRLLEKQWEIMTTYLSIDPQGQRIVLMRGDEVLKSFPVQFFPPRAIGYNLSPLPSVVRITSKERFAHPERGQSELVDGKLVWTPPQVGTSVRSNALGEYVMFTTSGLILHGPPTKPQEHDVFPHLCLGLSLSAARDLYRNSFIGTKIITSIPQKSDLPGTPQKIQATPLSPRTFSPEPPG